VPHSKQLNGLLQRHGRLRRGCGRGRGRGAITSFVIATAAGGAEPVRRVQDPPPPLRGPLRAGALLPAHRAAQVRHRAPGVWRQQHHQAPTGEPCRHAMHALCVLACSKQSARTHACHES
jgi:hypothetical protein